MPTREASSPGPDRPRSIASELHASVKAPGFAAAVWKRGAIAWSFAGGKAELLTAAAAVRLSERGALDLDAPIQLSPGSSITVARTRRHIKDDSGRAGDEVFPSACGFNLLGRARNGRVAGLIPREVYEPTGMPSTGADEKDRVIPGRTRFYTLAGDQIANAPYTDLSDRWPSGGFLSTAEDLARFGGLHLSDGYLKPESRRGIFTSQATTDGKETGTSFAWNRPRAARKPQLRTVRGAASDATSRLFCVG